jgi:hypothetical protein
MQKFRACRNLFSPIQRHEDAVHHGDLLGRPAERQSGDPCPTATALRKLTP